LSLKHLIFASSLLSVPVAHAAEPLACQNTLDTQLSAFAQSSMTPLPDETSIELTAGEMEAQMSDKPSASMTGGVLLRRADKLAGADSATFDPENRAMHLQGEVRYEDPGTQILSDSAEFSYDSGRIVFRGAEFTLGANNARGSADNLLINQQGQLQLDKVRYTTCPPGSKDWELQADDIDLDTQSGVGTAHGIKLRFKNIPILYAPYISFPISDTRKSGILTPEIGSSGRSGSEISVPYYWNIAPNYDATITPRLLTKRGLQVQTEFRYLTETNEGTAIAQYLPDDDLTSEARHLLNVSHQTLFRSGWRNQIEYREVSDNQYFEDLGGSLSASSITQLNRSVRFDWHTDSMSFFGQVQDYQTLDDAILPAEKPYQRLPQLLFNGYWPNQLMGLAPGIDGEIVNFDRDVGVTGWRLSVSPQLELPIKRPGWFMTPAVAFDYTLYDLSNTLPGEETDPSRSLPIASFDTGMILERMMRSKSDSRRIQTIEPRLLFVHIPLRDQDGLPVFDTIMPDLNLVQLFRKNRFLGIDRIGDTNQLSVGITSRVLDASTGKELVSATIGQTRYFSDRQVSLPGGSPSSFESSDYIATVRFLLYDNWNFDIGQQWGSGTSKTVRSEARLQYRPEGNKILNLAYRFRRDSIEQGDVSWAWPISNKWNFVGRYNYSFRDREVLEQFFGLEFESCCWGLRLVSRRFITTRDGTRDTSFGLQLVLKGMTSVGTAADKLLERGILGYSANLR
jgi:LPS-assembly protein